MTKREYRILEFDKIRDLLALEAASELTRERIRALEPEQSTRLIEHGLAETSEAVSVIMHKGSLHAGAISDIRGSVLYAEKGGVLNMRQLLDIKYHLTTARAAVSFLKSDLPELPIITELRNVLAIHKNLENEIENGILSETEMADSASHELKRIRRAIGIQNESIRGKLNQIINATSHKGLLQDSIVTMRQGRYVIPVKQEHKSRFPGMIHDQSSTGATLFIEPQAVVNLNNELRELELAETREIERILAEYSAMVAEVGPEIVNNQEILIKLDLIFAKGRLSVNMKASEALINSNCILRIKNGRHPLIPAANVVPINLELGKHYKTLIITGPNTGGKTVTLKTTGLFVLMTAAGLHIPADYGTEIPVGIRVYADIGDEQSIEQSLSTFSSHMKNIVEIISREDGRALVLLDELGAGTDPAEGAALGIALLEFLKETGACTMATTHYTELKKYAIATEGVENASMEFDLETLSPTFKLKTGLPGRSNAFEISRKLGLSNSIIKRAKSLLQTEDIKFETVIRKIEKDRRAAEEELDQAAELKLQMKKQKEALDEERRKLEEKMGKMLANAREDARETIREAKEYADVLMRELRELPQIGDERERNRRLESDRKILRELDGKYREIITESYNNDPLDPKTLRIGDWVRVLDLDQNGEIVTLPDGKGDIQVQVGRMKINTNASRLERVADDGKDRPIKRKGHSSLYMSKVQNITPSISVRGENLEDALMAVDKYLDDAFIAGLREVTVIHGRGEGILREGIQRMLKQHKHVKRFRNGDYGEGGEGVTVCTLK